jgi:hypothetical protein
MGSIGGAMGALDFGTMGILQLIGNNTGMLSGAFSLGLRNDHSERFRASPAAKGQGPIVMRYRCSLGYAATPCRRRR